MITFIEGFIVGAFVATGIATYFYKELETELSEAKREIVRITNDDIHPNR